ncbi:hypothetical protein [Desertibaculum subflavum]|uniref:hypothetical protein n=1 Tax=Desertibaculum subflavum TaxID=2268458 RepID=UPI000E66086C
MIVRALGALACLVAASAAARDGAIRPLWLTEEAEIGALPADRPVGPPPGNDPRLALGELVFRAPAMLGGEARRAGLSCDSCHPNGGANTTFFVPGLSAAPGTIDVTHTAWNPANDDGVANPLRIPPLWNLPRTAPYGHQGRFGDLTAFVRHVIVDEFAGGEPAPALLGALVAYIEALPAPANRNLTHAGRLSRAAPPGSGRGGEAFSKGCAGCHRPAADYQDGKVHPMRGGGTFATPSLRGIGALSRFFHDGRADDLTTAIASHARDFGIQHGVETRQWITDYVAAIGAVDQPAREPVTLKQDLDRIERMARLLPAGAAGLEAEIARMLQDEIGRVHARFPAEAPGPARVTLEGWAEALREIAQTVETGQPTSSHWLALQRQINEERTLVEAAAPASLYDPDLLAAWKASRRAR